MCLWSKIIQGQQKKEKKSINERVNEPVVLVTRAELLKAWLALTIG